VASTLNELKLMSSKLITQDLSNENLLISWLFVGAGGLF